MSERPDPIGDRLRAQVEQQRSPDSPDSKDATVLHTLAREISEKIAGNPAAVFDEAYATRHLLVVREAVRRLCWLRMTYQCSPGTSRKGHVGGCGYRYQVYCALGVEGPPGLKDAGLYIASALMHRCPTGCGGTAGHVNFSADEELDPLVVAPDDAAWFHLPETTSSNGGAALEWPSAAIVAARRWHHEERQAPEHPPALPDPDGGETFG